MSQKTNPISLRLQKTNISFPLSLFADYFWSDIYQTCFENQNYLAAFLKESGYSQAIFSARVFYRKFSVFLFVQDNRVSKKNALFSLKKKSNRNSSLPTPPLQASPVKGQFEKKKDKFKTQKGIEYSATNIFQKTTPFSHERQLFAKAVGHNFLKVKQGFFKKNFGNGLSLEHRDSPLSSFGHFSSNSSTKIFSRSCLSFCEEVLSLQGKPFTFNLSLHDVLLSYKDERRLPLQKDPKRSLKKTLSFFPTQNTLEPIRFLNEDQNVMAVLDMVVALLEKQVAFRQIKSFLFRQLSLKPQIEGIRISCSGRLGGRSKKAQKAKVQCDSFGTTTLSTFSSKIIFGSKSAFTPYGKIGVKVWLSYKDIR